MGYEIKLIIGKASALIGDEWKLSNQRYKDDSGFEPEKDAKGKIVLTGRKEHWFQVFATLDLCKIGGEAELNRVINASFKRGKEVAKTDVHYFYGEDGNTPIKDDQYGDL